VPAGYFELDGRNGEEIWLAYFGIIPEFRGRGLGKWLLSEALAAAWLKEPERVRVETCTLDDPRALPLYQRMGFVPYERRQKVMEVHSFLRPAWPCPAADLWLVWALNNPPCRALTSSPCPVSLTRSHPRRQSHVVRTSPLPYDYEALQPYMSRETLEFTTTSIIRPM
jgi:hypothetical protein